jgi:hypothetical protein
VLTWKFSIPTPLFSLAATAISPSLLFQPRAQYSLSFLKRAGAPSSHGSFLLAPSPRIFTRRALLWPWDRLATSPSILLCVRRGSHGAFFFHGRGHPPFSPLAELDLPGPDASPSAPAMAKGPSLVRARAGEPPSPMANALLR